MLPMNTPAAMRKIGCLLIVTWMLYLLCIVPIRTATISVAAMLMVLCAVAGIVAGLLAMRSAKRWRMVFGAATLILIVLYILIWMRAAMTLGDVMQSDTIWTLLSTVLKTKVGMVGHLLGADSVWAAFQQTYWELMPIVQAGIWIAVTFSGEGDGTGLKGSGSN